MRQTIFQPPTHFSGLLAHPEPINWSEKVEKYVPRNFCVSLGVAGALGLSG